ncbi:hypothetical protein C1631_007170 [Chryseobacterium phosphatilyticum]|uniref:RiboL-PSP-HEPN domain-containing protein n=1 Tax=Chryseobacterium phosphatilyticum TaxID=475075 RepID=A0A316XN46_9FLAO|nr:hypothetical protein [Chryseobacterium phosphatilyticum]PWN72370.1 hypothetical protein C1631_007170 [Chryseobacterium phosphatilyticum]
MVIFEAPDNIYWAFSSSAQAVAAFIGFISAGFFFSHDRIDRAVERDDTLLEIYSDIKNQHFKELRRLLWFTGASIILSLLVVFLNGFDIGYSLYISEILVASLNAYTIVKAVLLVVDMIDPQKIENTANKLLIKESSGEDAGGSASSKLSRGEFLDKFFELEELAREVLKLKVDYSAIFEPQFSNVIRELSQFKLINNQQLFKLNKITKIRNLVVHGRIEKVDAQIGVVADELIQDFKSILKK